MYGTDRHRRVDPASERGAVPVSVILLLAAIAALVYAVLGATVTDPDTYGTVPVPSDSLVELPGRETEISLARPAGSPAALPPDLRVTVVDGAGVAQRVDARGGDPYERDGLTIRPVAAVFPPADGTYRVEVTGEQAAAQGATVMLGEGPIGSIGARFERLGELITGPFGILAGLLLLLALVWPSFGRALSRGG